MLVLHSQHRLVFARSQVQLLIIDHVDDLVFVALLRWDRDGQRLRCSVLEWERFFEVKDLLGLKMNNLESSCNKTFSILDGASRDQGNVRDVWSATFITGL